VYENVHFLSCTIYPDQLVSLCQVLNFPIFYMKTVASTKLIAVSLAVASLCALSTLSANAALDVTASDATVTEPSEPLPAPASDFAASTSSASFSASPNVIRTPVPEPGTMFAGAGALAYFLFKSGRRSRS
jgi:hypothetical protein